MATAAPLCPVAISPSYAARWALPSMVSLTEAPCSTPFVIRERSLTFGSVPDSTPSSASSTPVAPYMDRWPVTGAYIGPSV